MAFETDLLDYGDIFDGSTVIERAVDDLAAQARDELAKIEAMGGAVAAIDTGYMKQRLVASNAKRLAAIEAGEQIVVGVNAFTETETSPLTTGDDAIQTIAPGVEDEAIAALESFRSRRDGAAVDRAMAQLRRALSDGDNVMESSIACASAGVTTGEWGATLRQVYGQYRAPTGVGRAPAGPAEELKDARDTVSRASSQLGRRLKLLVGKPGLDGHSNGAEQIAVRARDCGIEVVYEGIRLTPAEIAGAALEEGVHVVGLSILSGSHMALVEDVLACMAQADQSHVPLVVGGIIPPDDARALMAMGVAEVFTPKDYRLTEIICRIAEIATAAADDQSRG